MYYAERLFEKLSYRDLLHTLKIIRDEDCLLSDFLVDELTSEFVYMLELYDLIYLASDERLLLTPKGEKVLEYITFTVEIEKNSSKLKKYE